MIISSPLLISHSIGDRKHYYRRLFNTPNTQLNGNWNTCIWAYVTEDIIVRTVKREIIKIWSRQMAWESDWIFCLESDMDGGAVQMNVRTICIKAKKSWSETKGMTKMNCRYWERSEFRFIEKRDGKPVYTWSMTLLVYGFRLHHCTSYSIRCAVVSVYIHIYIH